MTALRMPRLYPVALFHWRAAVPGVVALAVLSMELCAVAVWLSRVIR